MNEDDAKKLDALASELADKLDRFRTPWPDRKQVEGLIFWYLQCAYDLPKARTQP